LLELEREFEGDYRWRRDAGRSKSQLCDVASNDPKFQRGQSGCSTFMRVRAADWSAWVLGVCVECVGELHPRSSRKRKQPDLHLEPVFEKIFAAANASNKHKDVVVEFLKEIKNQLESTSAKETHKPAKSITLEDAVHYFSLTYGSKYPDSLRFHWKIETLPDVKEMQPSLAFVIFFLTSLICIDSSFIASFLADYTGNYDRSSEAACRVAVDLIIAYCLAELVSHLEVFLENSRYEKFLER
jgi:hypothetical protein